MIWEYVYWPDNIVSLIEAEWLRPTLAQIIACHLKGAKPLFETMLDYC